MTTLKFASSSIFNLDKAPRTWLPDPEALVTSCVDAITAGKPSGLDEIFSEMGAPALDMSVTPLTTRAALLGADHGRAFYHHELRRRLPMPPELEPEITVWEAGTVPVWSDGVLAEPKYFSFFQDAPFPAYNPNHRRKWRAHELLHGASKFFWHPQMTRFEFYVSARLNELLPVVHWYALDEIFRPRCEDHLDQVLHREHCLRCQDAAIPYWESTAHKDPERREAALRFVDQGWSHFEEEWQAITEEIEAGRRVPTPRPYLDASSDAVGYMKAHWNRTTAWSFGHWAETYLIDGVDYFSTLDALKENVGRSLQRLVSGSIEVSPEVYLARRTRSQLQDLGYRAMLALEWLDPDTAAGQRAEEALMPTLLEGADLARDLLQNPALTGRGLDHFARTCQIFSTTAPLFPDEIADTFLGFGYRFIDAPVFATAATGQLFSGLEDALPHTIEEMKRPVETVQAFAFSEEFDELGRLSQRFARWIASRCGEGQPFAKKTAEVARFEAFINAEPRVDSEATDFAAIPQHASNTKNKPGLLRPHHTLRRDRFSTDLLFELTGQTFPEQGEVAVAASLPGGELRIIIEDDDITTVLDRVVAEEPVEDWWDLTLSTALMHLLEMSLITWLPAPRR